MPISKDVFDRALIAKIKGSDLMFTAAVGEPTPEMCLELGAALLYGKPLIVMVPAGRTLSPGLRRAADEILENYELGSPELQKALGEAVQRQQKKQE